MVFSSLPDQPASRIFALQARNNAWANCRLLSGVLALPYHELTETRAGFFPSLIKTFNHILTVDWFYVDALEKGSLGLKAFDPEFPYSNMQEIFNAQTAVDARLVAYCDTLTDEKLGGVTQIHRGQAIQLERTENVLLHLLQHQIHHRGQAHAMLSGTSITPPQLDEFFMDSDAEVRAADLIKLGLI